MLNARCSSPASISACWTPTTPASRSPGAVAFDACSAAPESLNVAIPTAGTVTSSASPIATTPMSVIRRIVSSSLSPFIV
jgi:hypothetical protein